MRKRQKVSGDMMKMEHSIGKKVYWIASDNKVRVGTVLDVSLCEYQGALYLELNSPTFKKNPYPTVHYSNCFSTRDEADELARELRDTKGWGLKRCDRCEFEYRKAMTKEG